MKYAELNGERLEASKGAHGVCPYCKEPVIAKCGERKIHHWAHKSKKNCDPWWETETEWHRRWKDCFPREWQEIAFKSSSGERHIADVHTPHGLTIEFQHSFITPEERKSREAFYGNIIWVVDGTRLKKERERFTKILNLVKNKGSGFSSFSANEISSLFNPSWISSGVPVFFDFKDDLLMDSPQVLDCVRKFFDTVFDPLWYILPWRDQQGNFSVGSINRGAFIEGAKSGKLLYRLLEIKNRLLTPPRVVPRLFVRTPYIRRHRRF